MNHDSAAPAPLILLRGSGDVTGSPTLWALDPDPALAELIPHPPSPEDNANSDPPRAQSTFGRLSFPEAHSDVPANGTKDGLQAQGSIGNYVRG
jgi:hypothetical protein